MATDVLIGFCHMIDPKGVAARVKVSFANPAVTTLAILVPDDIQTTKLTQQTFSFNKKSPNCVLNSGSLFASETRL